MSIGNKQALPSGVTTPASQAVAKVESAASEIGVSLQHGLEDLATLPPYPPASGQIQTLADGGIDQHLANAGVRPQREFRTTYDERTEEGRVRRYRHQINRAETADDWINKEFFLVAVTSYLVRKNDEESGEQVTLLRTCLETSQGVLIESYSDWLYQSLREIGQLRGWAGPMELNLRTCIEKRGRAHALRDLDLADGKIGD